MILIFLSVISISLVLLKEKEAVCMNFILLAHQLFLVSAKSDDWQVFMIVVQVDDALEPDVKDSTKASFIDKNAKIPEGKGS
jgi:hypothetical protein